MIDILVAWSGGKDSTLALAALRADPGYRVLGLLTTLTRDYDRISMHGVRRSVLEAQVHALGLPLIETSIASSSTNADYEAAFTLGLSTAAERWPGLRHIAFGDLFLADVREYREQLLAASGWTGVFPLWGQNTAELAWHFVRAGYRALLTCVDTTQLAGVFAGREFDRTLLAELPPTVDPCGERGEFHTCVYAGPLFARPLPLVTGDRMRRDGRFEYCDVLLEPAATAAA
ncbi:MAG: ATP-binding protein [Gemmatimonadales bacterium]